MKKQWKSVLGGLSALLLLSCSVVSFGQELRGLKVNDQIDTVKKAIQSKKAQWVAGETSLSKLSPEEQQARVGYNFELPNIPPLSRSKLVTRAPLPESVDWRKKGVVARIKDQGQCGSCWAFAMTGGLESYVMRAQDKERKVELSEQVMVSCSGAGSCNGGRLNANFLKTTGLPSSDYYPYSASDGDCGEAKDGWQDASYKIDSWGSISANLGDMKSALAQYGPLPTALWVYEDLMHYQSGVYSYTSGKKLGGHAVILVGYNDPGHYFIVKNSWGTGWGEDGYFRVDYSQLDSVISFGMMSIAYTSNPNDNDFPKMTDLKNTLSVDQVVEDSPLTHTARRTMLAQ